MRTIAASAPSAILLTAIVTLSTAQPAAAQASTPGAGRPLVVVIKPLEPFVNHAGDGPTGFSIDLWSEVARRNGWPYEYRWVETVGEQVSAVEQGSADLAVAGISMTTEREGVVDFSYPIFSAGLQIMTPARAATTSLDTALRLVLPNLLRIVGFLLLVNLVVAHVIWLVERRRNPQFEKGYLRGVWDGFWWSAVTLTTVGYGDKTPISTVGRVVGIFWMFTGLLIVANFTATITAQLTMREIHGAIAGVGDLPGRRVATVEGSTAERFLADHGVAFTAVRAIDDAYRLLEQGQADAVVYDSPVLLYHAATAGRGRVRLVGSIFKPESYGIALPEGSPLREPLNRALLAIANDGTYQQLYGKWFESES